MADHEAGRVLLADAVATAEAIIGDEGHGGRGHIMHVLFVLRAAGCDVDYATLACLTGYPFTFYYCHDNYHVAYSIPDGWEERVARATGFAWEWVPHYSLLELFDHIRDTIASGRLATAEYPEGVTFAGVEDAPQPEGRRLFSFDPDFEWPGKWWDWSKIQQWYVHWGDPETHRFRTDIGRIAKRVEAAPPREMAIEMLRSIPVWSEDTHPESLPEARFGLAGIEAYASDIADLSEDEEYMAGPWRGCHAINPQWRARACPSVYLQRIAGALDGPARRRVLAAARQYEQAYALWVDWSARLGGPAGRDAWSSANQRQAGAAAIRRACAHERAAVDEIREALQASS